VTMCALARASLSWAEEAEIAEPELCRVARYGEFSTLATEGIENSACSPQHNFDLWDLIVDPTCAALHLATGRYVRCVVLQGADLATLKRSPIRQAARSDAFHGAA